MRVMWFYVRYTNQECYAGGPGSEFETVTRNFDSKEEAEEVRHAWPGCFLASAEDPWRENEKRD